MSRPSKYSPEFRERAVRLALESRRRVKEQQKRIGAAEFGNTRFSYRVGDDGDEQVVATPEGRGAGDEASWPSKRRRLNPWQGLRGRRASPVSPMLRAWGLRSRRLRPCRFPICS